MPSGQSTPPSSAPGDIFAMHRTIVRAAELFLTCFQAALDSHRQLEHNHCTTSTRTLT
jgi:hypothetical protein